MRKAQINDLVREQLAMLGYSAGSYGWPKRGRLSILVDANAILRGDAKTDNPMPGAYIELRLPGGMSRKKAMAALEALPKRGPAKPVARRPEASTAMQMPMEIA